MGKTKERRENSESQVFVKRRKVDLQQLDLSDQKDRPKSKKELRAEKKAARKASERPSSSEPLSKEEYKIQKNSLRKEMRREMLREQLREERKEKKFRQQKRLNRGMNAPKKEKKPLQNKQSTKASLPSKMKAKKLILEEDEIALKVLGEVIHGSRDESGMMTLKLGIQYKDVVVGAGAFVKNKSLTTVQYKLTGGKFGAVLDSSKTFKFRVGKGEVIQGWDIGVLGMREGGRRKLIVPPKAGYGSQDIGAGPGGILYFDISVLSVRGGA
jgi:FKBP-type peptidyl-prolyl cis-trans isomerase